eukprot:CAMPEP_0198644902 /NCGR_PEP_ID=MMETSP1467-20131203/921_1 /TAXON_ID=1462469 /ORGANISM="unid. sp., Strain CCMP2135" /LENGTH=138 /DNA_ID=CAMNT_0044380371 /DNA_START=1 /DNA_END=417 /DNA_ORIENTATION=-
MPAAQPRRAGAVGMCSTSAARARETSEASRSPLSWSSACGAAVAPECEECPIRSSEVAREPFEDLSGGLLSFVGSGGSAAVSSAPACCVSKFSWPLRRTGAGPARSDSSTGSNTSDGAPKPWRQFNALFPAFQRNTGG